MDRNLKKKKKKTSSSFHSDENNMIFKKEEQNDIWAFYSVWILLTFPILFNPHSNPLPDLSGRINRDDKNHHLWLISY